MLEQCGEDPTFLSAASCRSSAPTRASGRAASSWPRPTSRTARSRACARAPRSCSTPSSTTTTTSHSLDDLHALFRAWVAELPREGVLVLHESLDYAGRCAIRRYGAGPGEGWRALDVAPDGEGTRFVLAAPGRDPLPLRLGVPGAHNALNATAALALLDWAGIAPGARRRPAGRVPRRRAPLRAQGRGRRHPPRRRLRAPSDRARRHAHRGARRGPARAAPGLLPAAHALAHAACSPTASRRRCGWPMPPASATSTSRAARPTRRSPASSSSRARDGRIRASRSPGRPGTPMRPTGSSRTARPGDLVLTLGAGPVDSVLELVRERLA